MTRSVPSSESVATAARHRSQDKRRLSIVGRTLPRGLTLGRAPAFGEALLHMRHDALMLWIAIGEPPTTCGVEVDGGRAASRSVHRVQAECVRWLDAPAPPIDEPTGRRTDGDGGRSGRG